MKTFITITCLHCILIGFSQQRLGLDINYKSGGLHTNLTYQKVIYKSFLFSGGIALGNYGKSYINKYIATIQHDQLELPFVGISTSFISSDGISELQSYQSTIVAYGISVGLGAFKEFSIKHGIRFNLNTKILHAKSNVILKYGATNNGIHVHQRSTLFVASLSPELVHTIRLSGRMTFCYGIKAPYYFSLDAGKYHPKYKKDLFNGIEPELTIGLTRVIGTCD